MKKLLPCPFCGYDAEIREGQTHDTWFVRCTNCQCKTVTSYTKQEPTETWNTRAPVTVDRAITGTPSREPIGEYTIRPRIWCKWCKEGHLSTIDCRNKARGSVTPADRA